MIEIGQDPRINIARSILHDLFGPPDSRDFAVRYWDGTSELPAVGDARCTIILRRAGALRRMLLPPSELALGAAYLRDDFDVEGSLEAATTLAGAVAARLRSPQLLATLVRRLLALPAHDLEAARPARLGARLWQLGSRHSRERDAAAVRYHYDAGNAFYALWLDARMLYSCAYFASGADDLDEAQRAKLEHICRKLRLTPGERLLDIGCGWGGLILYAAQHFGVEALGITLSQPQAALARGRIASAGIADRCRVLVCDYRDLADSIPEEAPESFDKIASVGMFEHVGRARLPAYYAAVYRLLRPGGLFLNHGIAATAHSPWLPRESPAERLLLRPGAFVQRYVFPDGELIAPGTAITLAEAAGFETRDVENLREHYALTLRHWVRRLEAQHAEAARLAGEAAYRVWRLYMSGAAHAFATNRNQLIQALYSKPHADGTTELPPTRADLYH